MHNYCVLDVLTRNERHETVKAANAVVLMHAMQWGWAGGRPKCGKWWVENEGLKLCQKLLAFFNRS